MANHFLKVFLRILIFVPVFSFAQSVQQDTAFLASSIIQTKKIYSHAAQGQAQLYNGTDYADYKSYKDEHPYFISDDWELCKVEYSGESFENVPILYNISTDKVISEHFYSSNKMQLISELIGSFTFQNRKFVRLIEDPSKASTVKTGFYEVLYNGKTKAYAKRIKAFQKTVSFEELIVSFDEKNRYYIYKNDVYFEVSSKGSILQVLSDKKQELKHFLKENHIRFKSDKEKALVAMTTYYDTITR